MSSIEILEHTADIGFRVRAAGLSELFELAAEALASVAFELEDAVPRQTYPLEASGEDHAALLVNWLSEVLWLIDGRRLALREFRVASIEAGLIRGEAVGEPWDAARHHAKLIVKGVTYHQLAVTREETGWCAEVFLDI